jgi:hypothetical protein
MSSRYLNLNLDSPPLFFQLVPWLLWINIWCSNIRGERRWGESALHVFAFLLLTAGGNLTSNCGLTGHNKTFIAEYKSILLRIVQLIRNL